PVARVGDGDDRRRHVGDHARCGCPACSRSGRSAMMVPRQAAPRLVYVEVLGAYARQTPSKTALIDPSGRYTYADLWSAVRAVSAWLCRAGVRSGDRVVTAMTPSAPHVAVIFGIMAAGAVA